MDKARNELLRREREKRGWSQARVAEQIGTEAVNVSRWERGYATPSPYFREKLCLLFGKDARELGFLENEEKNSESASQATAEEVIPVQPLPVSHAKIDLPGNASRWWAGVSHIFGWLSGLFLFLLNRDHFVRFHSLQALFFFGASNILSCLILWMMSVVEKMYANPTQTLINGSLALLLFLLNLFTFIVWVVGIIQAWRGKYYPFPFVGSLSERLVGRSLALAQRSK
ncbi:putative membrane protein [Thermosporothrix hazakensis]|jgi:uncharacterized membrane protein/DNA-binding XRE family transcriptional regulator|uniref:Putative membrane protein n=1 Tax=Thermosporothrix hazakensis TaxID=644383 RepID=A0A326UC35_THEHA|nr:helix-turn-helix domain-containing protein [Thermosporothrix hazakensis]PZW31252.1 putative membrane protein [Thermosporothrix hazakensis]GCE50835.1 hypothetical protein KTH_57040 [Thermosporothrix hazakensis]